MYFVKRGLFSAVQSPNLMNLSRVSNLPKTGLNLETLNTILSGTHHYWAAARPEFKPRLKFFKFGLSCIQYSWRYAACQKKSQNAILEFLISAFHYPIFSLKIPLFSISIQSKLRLCFRPSFFSFWFEFSRSKKVVQLKIWYCFGV